MAKLAEALSTLRNQVNRAAPNRSTRSDGWIASAQHSKENPDSDHEPGKPPEGVVCALDITHDPDGGLDAYNLADRLIDSKDPRIKYVISNRRFASSYNKTDDGKILRPAWKWVRYHGKNPHTNHTHISVLPNKKHYNNPKRWDAIWEDRPDWDYIVGVGDRGPIVRDFQNILELLTPGALPQYGVDGIYGQETSVAVRLFQKSEGLVEPYGNIDETTAGLLLLRQYQKG